MLTAHGREHQSRPLSSDPRLLADQRGSARSGSVRSIRGGRGSADFRGSASRRRPSTSGPVRRPHHRPRRAPIKVAARHSARSTPGRQGSPYPGRLPRRDGRRRRCRLGLPAPAAHAARAKELECTAEQDAAQQALERAAKRATPALLSVLSRYPATSLGTTRVAELVHSLDTALRAQRCPEGDQR